MKSKRNLLQIGSILMIVCAAVAIVLTVVNSFAAVNSVTAMGADEAGELESLLTDNGITMDQAMMAFSGFVYVSLGIAVIFNVVKIIIGVLGIRKADQPTKFFLIWGIIFLACGITSLSTGFSLLGICNFLGGIIAPVLFILGANPNRRAAP